MSTSPAPQAADPQPKTVKKRIYIPLILLLLFLLIGVAFYVRGTWADTVEKNPAAPAEGTVTQLLEKPNKNVVVRCAILVDAAPKEVWAVVSGYDKHAGFLQYVSKVEATTQADGKIKIDGVAHSRIWGDWPFQSLATHDEKPDDGEYSATWSEEEIDEFKVNRGGWHLKPAGKNQTLLTFTLQVELKRYPNFIVRNIVMDRLHAVLTSMRDETLRRKKA